MQKFENQIVSEGQCLVERGPAERENIFRFTQNEYVRDLECMNCEFIGEGLTTYGAPVHRSSARNIRLKNCVMNSFFGTGAIFDDVIVDGLRTSVAPVITFGCVFRHVVLMGKCGRFLFDRDVCHDDPDRNAAFEKANTAFYETVDWALDISKLKPSDLEIRGSIPTHLIRRNPEEHFIMTRPVAQSGDWRDYEPFDSFSIAISIFLDSKAEDNLFVAARQSKNFKREVEYYHRLKSAGLMT